MNDAKYEEMLALWEPLIIAVQALKSELWKDSKHPITGDQTYLARKIYIEFCNEIDSELEGKLTARYSSIEWDEFYRYEPHSSKCRA